MRTCILALVNPGSLTIVGLQSTTYSRQTYHHVSAGHARLAAESGADAAHLWIFTLAGWHISPKKQTRPQDNKQKRKKDSTHLARIPCLLPQLPHSRLLRRLALINQTGWELDAESLDRRAVLHDDHSADGFARVLENRHDGDGIDARGLTGLARGGFPDALLAVLELGVSKSDG